VRVEKEYQSNLPQVEMDEALCEQAFVNIIQNAYDAMSSDNGGVLRVRVTAARHSTRERENVDGVEVRIADTGPGIPPELREQIFNPFVTTKKSGVGLGLSIVSKIVDGHHGSVRIEDAPTPSGDGTNRGACFVIFLPAATAASPKAEKTHLVIS
jgi:signal transduction histidine kinase